MIKVFEQNETNAERAINEMIKYLDGLVYGKGDEVTEFELMPERTKNGFKVEFPGLYGMCEFTINEEDKIIVSSNYGEEWEERLKPEELKEVISTIIKDIQQVQPGYDAKQNKNLWSRK